MLAVNTSKSVLDMLTFLNFASAFTVTSSMKTVFSKQSLYKWYKSDFRCFNQMREVEVDTPFSRSQGSFDWPAPPSEPLLPRLLA